MFKKIFVSCLLISLFFSPGVQAEENWISHTEKRFSVHYPEGWSISTVGEETDLFEITTTSRGESEGFGTVNAIIDIENFLLYKKNLRGYIRLSLKGLKDEGFNLVSVKKKKGKEAYIITSKKEDTDNFFMVEQHISIVEKGIAIVTIGSFENDFESMRATFQSILKELKIK